MVPYLGVSVEGLKRLVALATLDREHFSKLSEAIREEIDSFSERSSIVAYAKKNAPKHAKEFASAIEAVVPLMLNEEYADASPDSLIEGVFAAVDRNAEADLVKPAHRKLIKARLKALLTDQTAKLRAKAWTLVLERPCLLQDARIITDIRPVFTDKNPASLQACSVIHTLVLECTENSSPKTMHIALDTSDLGKLRNAISRAEVKQRRLASFLADSGVPSLQIKSSEDL